MAINSSVRRCDEWFDEPDDLERLERVLTSLETVSDPVIAAGLLMARIARAQAFSEGNKRTALLAGQWVLDHNDVPISDNAPSLDNQVFAQLLVQASTGLDVEREILAATCSNFAASLVPHKVPDGRCGSPTKRGTSCRRRGRCPYHEHGPR